MARAKKSTTEGEETAVKGGDTELVIVNGEPHYKTVDEDGNEVLKSA